MCVFVYSLARPATGGFFGLKGRWEPREQSGEPRRRTRHPWLYWDDVVAYLRATWPFWDASGGKDHVFVFSGDHGETLIHPLLYPPSNQYGPKGNGSWHLIRCSVMSPRGRTTRARRESFSTHVASRNPNEGSYHAG